MPHPALKRKLNFKQKQKTKMDKSKSNGSHRASNWEAGGSSKGVQTKEANRSEMQSSQLTEIGLKLGAKGYILGRKSIDKSNS